MAYFWKIKYTQQESINDYSRIFRNNYPRLIDL